MKELVNLAFRKASVRTKGGTKQRSGVVVAHEFTAEFQEFWLSHSKRLVEIPGIEPGFRRCERRVIPLYHIPAPFVPVGPVRRVANAALSQLSYIPTDLGDGPLPHSHREILRRDVEGVK